MLGGIPPFGGTDDADIENVLQWFLGSLNADDWSIRVAANERNIETGMQPRTRSFHAEDYVSAYGGRDRIAWYLYLVDTALHEPLKYEPIQGARILPIFKRLGADLGLLKRSCVEERVQSQGRIAPRRASSTRRGPPARSRSPWCARSCGRSRTPRAGS